MKLNSSDEWLEEIKEMMYDRIEYIKRHRNKIIEDYVSFYLAATVPDDYLTPEYVADNFVLECEGYFPNQTFRLVFKEKTPNPRKD